MPDVISQTSQTDRDRWIALLDEMEQRAADASRSIPLAPKTAEEPAGPMPADLAERAAEVVGAQRRAIERLQGNELKAASLLRVMNTLPLPKRGDVPVYVDRIG